MENIVKVEIEKKHKKIEEDTTTNKIKNKLNEHNFFFKNFLEKLKVDKIYLISFLITLTFLSVTSVIKVKHADGYLNKNQTDINQKENNNDTTLTPAKDAEQEEIDVSDYVGIYSKEYILDNVITFGENCTVDSYKYIYQINTDGTISKYFNNSCIGTIKIWSDNYPYNLIQILDGHTQCVHSIFLLKETQILISGSSDNTLRKWTLSTYQCIKVFNDVICWTRNIIEIDNNATLGLTTHEDKF